MSALSELVPKEKQRLIDLVKAAGVDVSEWGDFAGGERNAAKNPKFCYEWSFVVPGKVVLLNLWHHMMKELDSGVIVHESNMREFAHKCREPAKTRALKFDEAIGFAVRDKLPIRVVIGEGRRRDPNDPTAEASKVFKRFLDSVAWTVTAYDATTGQCTLTRGAHRFADQFAIQQESAQPARRDVSGQVFVRSTIVRSNVLLRANGKCEWCGEAGFVMPDGRIYLETHHVDSLCDGGSDTEANVAALCANHHREAHHGMNRETMREELLVRIGTSASTTSA